MTDESKRRNSNAGNVLRLLHSRGSVGATNEELISCGGYRYGARIHELRQAGWEITTAHEDGGTFRFRLIGRKTQKQAAIQTSLFAEAR